MDKTIHGISFIIGFKGFIQIEFKLEYTMKINDETVFKTLLLVLLCYPILLFLTF
jgi:hypothetical protein